ncbi:UDP-N-acetylmuramoyl-L-alanyl-D-glutamate--2,6-diaminopimelate ligase [Shimazuella sp. AN120528]|uniref:UDP-N-acetylmuramoyl-L-alanyl-D-glutamate--2, 6-diaminopimelate ligase n=1 Tax=Shimazuella soli TaxID=1892854 RepID=UPI001F112D29|nr:UDP-N-acetylmuramoyl-L-alanyl-D-glutamate--2,6-diaminopimelate ligase [Shimazuella soli]MCH5584700.1 UDP-N-acetylmuramoyl-L-alanyl-D-glutamate--2,6-diaminopimelate ligase [Shimazuella soli]
MKLSELVDVLHVKEWSNPSDRQITGIETDSRKVKQGNLFIALRGFTVDGHDYIQTAVENGAVAVLVEESVETTVPVIRVPDTRRAMGFLANTFYQFPSRQLKLIGITGTNGKTTTSHLIEQILTSVGRETGIIGTIGVKIKDNVIPVKNTTPDVVDLQKSLRYMVDEGAEYTVMEVSSHALHLGRTRGSHYHIAVFTNLTQDHLDYHETMEQYREAKGLLFSQLGNDYTHEKEKSQVAVLNVDDAASSYFATITPAQVITYGISKQADVRAVNIEHRVDGVSFELHTYQGNVSIRLPLFGTFNVYNSLAAASVALVEGISLAKIKQALESLTGVDGRFESVQAGQDYTVLVDYAHTPDSLQNVLTTAKSFAKGKVICVVGCGGDRDRGKRPLMAKIATEISDYAVITSDNPRTEEPKAIIADMVEGIPFSATQFYTTIEDRKAAIEYAVQLAKTGDVVLIAGKGHETYQEINGVRYPFDDRKIAYEAIKGEQHGT